MEPQTNQSVFEMLFAARSQELRVVLGERCVGERWVFLVMRDGLGVSTGCRPVDALGPYCGKSWDS